MSRSTQKSGDDTQLSPRMLQQARKSILKRVKLDRKHEVPYLAGYSTDGRTIYIDKNLPKTFVSKRRRIDPDRFLMFHEAVEKALIDKLGLNYQHAHQLAQQLERLAVTTDGVSWKDYQDFAEEHMDQAYRQQIKNIPPDLDLEPYRDEEDWEKLTQMQEQIRRERAGGKSRPVRRRKRK